MCDNDRVSVRCENTWQRIQSEQVPILIWARQTTGDAFCVELKLRLTLRRSDLPQQRGAAMAGEQCPPSLSAFLPFKIFLTCCKNDCGHCVIVCCCAAWCLWALKDIQNNHKSGRTKHLWTLTVGPQLTLIWSSDWKHSDWGRISDVTWEW